MVPDLHKACPECGARYPAADLRCPDCGVSWRNARARQQERQRTEATVDAATDFAGLGHEREAFRGGVVGGLLLFVVAGVLGAACWLLGWGFRGFLVTAGFGLVAAVVGLVTGNFSGKGKGRGGRKRS